MGIFENLINSYTNSLMNTVNAADKVGKTVKKAKAESKAKAEAKAKAKVEAEVEEEIEEEDTPESASGNQGGKKKIELWNGITNFMTPAEVEKRLQEILGVSSLDGIMEMSEKFPYWTSIHTSDGGFKKYDFESCDIMCIRNVNIDPFRDIDIKFYQSRAFEIEISYFSEIFTGYEIVDKIMNNYGKNCRHILYANTIPQTIWLTNQKYILLTNHSGGFPNLKINDYYFLKPICERMDREEQQKEAQKKAAALDNMKF